MPKSKDAAAAPALSLRSPNPKNPRRMTDARLKMLKASLDEFGDLSGIIFNRRSSQLVGGHQRTKVLPPEAKVVITKRFSKPTRVGTVATGYVSIGRERFNYREVDWPEAKEKAANIAANKHSGEWDTPQLTEWLVELDGLDFDMDLTGFTKKEVSIHINQTTIKAGLTDDDSVPDAPKEPRTKPGDLYQLGEHRLLCGDSTNIQHVERLMAGEKAQTFFADPPYGDNVGGLRTKSASERRPGKGLVTRDTFIANDKEIDWLDEVFNLVPGFMEEPSTKMVFFKWDKYELIKSTAQAFGEPSALCVWDRVRRASAFFRFQPQHELVFHWGNQADKKDTSNLSNVWREPKELELKDLHPTVKPIAILEPAISVTTDRGKIVLDLFGGSGSTMIACEKTGHRARLMELDPKYCDVIVSRWEAWTGRKAELVEEQGA
jgi:DNA modification methylase